MRLQFLGLGGCQLAGNVGVELKLGMFSVDLRSHSDILLARCRLHNTSAFQLFKHTYANLVCGYRSTGDPVMDKQRNNQWKGILESSIRVRMALTSDIDIAWARFLKVVVLAPRSLTLIQYFIPEITLILSSI